MHGDLDPAYISARTALLDAAEALAPHLDAIVLVGAQAVYLHTGEADLAVAAFTVDADFSIEPRSLADAPPIDRLLRDHGFVPREHPGGWVSPGGIYVDLMVPEALAGTGRRVPNSVHTAGAPRGGPEDSRAPSSTVRRMTSRRSTRLTRGSSR